MKFDILKFCFQKGGQIRQMRLYTGIKMQFSVEHKVVGSPFRQKRLIFTFDGKIE